uniref:Uncharacterized protein n=2 Tax=Ciona intestinalis TaxID=7719 RepID=F6WKJ4_CIOIN
MKRMWKHIMEVVHNKATVEKVATALELNKFKEDYVEGKAVCRSKEDELDKVSNEIRELEQKLKLKQAEITKSEFEMFSMRKDHTDVNSKNLILVCSIEKLQQQLESVKTNSKSLKKLVSDNAGKQTMSGSNSYAPCLAACAKDLKILAERIPQMVESGLNHKHSENVPKLLWSSAFQFVSKYPAIIISEAMTSLCVQHKNMVSKLISEINMEEDVNTLAQSYTLPSEGKAGVALWLALENYDAKCASEYKEALNHEKNAQRTMTEVDEVITRLKNSSAPEIADRNMLDAEISMVKHKEYLQSLKQSLEDLKLLVEDKTEIQRQHYLREREIKNFGKELVQNSHQIALCSKENLNLRQALLRMQLDAQNQESSLYSTLQPLFSETCQSLKRGISEEIAAFEAAFFDQLCTIQSGEDGKSNKIPVSDLTIHYPMLHPCITGGNTYQRISEFFNGNTVKSCSSLLERIIEDAEIVNKERINRNLLKDLEKISETKVKEIQNLKTKLQEVFEQEISRSIPLIEQGIKCSKHVESEANKLAKAVDNWFEEPGQYQAPWIQQVGENLDHVKQKLL